MSLRNLIKYFAAAMISLALVAASVVGLLAVDLQGAENAKCAYRGSETTERQPLVIYSCSDHLQFSEQWQEDLRIIRKYVVYDGSFACIIFTSAMNEYKISPSESTRTAFSDELHLYSGLLALASQTAENSPKFKEGIGLRAKLWAMQFRLARYVIEGPLTWAFPHDERDFGIWTRVYIATILMPAGAFEDMCEMFEAYRGACTSPEVMPTAYIEQYVNSGPSDDKCALY